MVKCFRREGFEEEEGDLVEEEERREEGFDGVEGVEGR